MSESIWYYKINAKKEGPVSEEELRLLYKRGRITLDTPVFTERYQAWKPLKNSSIMGKSTRITSTGNLLLFVPISAAKLIIMSIFTMGLYQPYWFYKNWQVIKKYEKSDISPYWRTSFYLFFCYDFFKRVKNYSGQVGVNADYNPEVMTILFAMMTIVGSLSTNLILIYFLSFLPLLPVLESINKLNKKYNYDVPVNNDFTIANIIAIIFGTAFMVLCFFVIKMIGSLKLL
ncbi:MAG: DUF4339 domain-containing protein [bacterium]